jgi:hypothetical protein
VAATPTAVTVFTAALGGFDPPNAWRAGLALPFGGVAGAIVGAVCSRHLK